MGEKEASAAASAPHAPLRASLFEPETRKAMRKEYLESGPYHHLVVPDLIDDKLLAAAKDEISEHITFTLKETDIYKVFQTGDLANMDGLPEAEKKQLASLFPLRGALYSPEFRRIVAEWTGSGPLSGRKIDLSINAYGHTHHLLCHDDVIGTRKVSYILYLVDDKWGVGPDGKPDGGALQLYPLEHENQPGTPAYAPTLSIPPKWNQMALFAVQPGHSFHDVQEVYSEERPRLAISGWFHGALGDELSEWPAEVIEQGKRHEAQCSSKFATLAQLEAASTDGGSTDGGFSKTFSTLGSVGLGLKDWINPEYLADGAAETIAEKFVENGSSIVLHSFLAPAAARKILTATKSADMSDNLGYRESAPFDVGARRNSWRKVGPPHRRRYLRLATEKSAEKSTEKDGKNSGGTSLDAEEEEGAEDEAGKALRAVRDELFGSDEFRRLLESFTGAAIAARRVEARRFRPGLDYTLASPPSWAGLKPEDMLLDAVLCFVDADEEYKEAAWQQDEVGGYQTYLGGDNDEEEPNNNNNNNNNNNSESDNKTRDSSNAPGNAAAAAAAADASSSADGNGHSNSAENGGSANSKAHDAAVYRSDDQEGLESVSAAPNALSLVLRDDASVLSFVKYVSAAAPGSRWDVAGEFVVPASELETSSSSQEDATSQAVVAEGVSAAQQQQQQEQQEQEEEDGGEGGPKAKRARR